MIEPTPEQSAESQRINKRRSRKAPTQSKTDSQVHLSSLQNSVPPLVGGTLFLYPACAGASERSPACEQRDGGERGPGWFGGWRWRRSARPAARRRPCGPTTCVPRTTATSRRGVSAPNRTFRTSSVAGRPTCADACCDRPSNRPGARYQCRGSGGCSAFLRAVRPGRGRHDGRIVPIARNVQEFPRRGPIQ